MVPQPSPRLRAVCAVAVAASRAILAVYAQEDLGVVQKSDDSPVTHADHAAQAVLMAGLPQVGPRLPVLSEESADPAESLGWSHYWLVDPLDGTREFIQRNGEFTVNIAEIRDGQTGLCVLAVPAKGVLYGREGQQVWRWPFTAGGTLGDAVLLSPQPLRRPWQLALSRRAAQHGGLYPRLVAHVQQHHPDAVCQQAGSAYKFALMAEGQIDAYPRLHPTSEWDTAAGQGLLEGLGGMLVDDQGRPFSYNQRQTWLNGRFLALRCAADWVQWEAFWLGLGKDNADFMQK